MLALRRWSWTIGATIAVGTALAPARASAKPLNEAERTERCAAIRDVAADNGIATGYLLAGIASAETSLSHCWTELDWACQGPASPDCDGGPVVAGAGDGPCSLQEGGLGMFQFDGGTFDETIARDGDGVLLLSGNITRGVDFVVDMVMRSKFTGAETQEEARAWLNSVVVGGDHWDDWIDTVTQYYNGCVPGQCSAYADRFAHYDDHGRAVFQDQGADFWQAELGQCAPIGSKQAVLEETDPCFVKGGPLPFWRVGIGGESNLHVWTGTTDNADPANFAQWMLQFDHPGEYKLEVAVHSGTSTQARYLVEHAGMTDEVVIDQAAADGFVELGTFDFAASGSQRVHLGDNTGEAGGEKLVADALRVTPLDISGGGGGGEGAGGDPGGEGGDGVGHFSGGVEGGCATAPAMPRGESRWLALSLAAAAGALARRRRASGWVRVPA
ncbi:MAG: hypothetical protein WKG00_34630 [Polyangiaceae bacterium]